MSKLRRKRVSVAEEIRPDRKTETRDHFERLLCAGGSGSSSGRDGSDGGSSKRGEPWWASADLTAEEKVWLTLQAFCPEAFSSPASVFCVPELPQSPKRVETESQSEWHWCHLDEEVPELPALKDPQGCIPNQCAKPCVPNEDLQPSAVKQVNKITHEPHTFSSQRPLEENPKSSKTRNERQASISQRPLEDNLESSETRIEQQASISQRPLSDNPKSSETRNERQVSISQRPLEDNLKSSETRIEQQVSTSQRPLSDNPKSSETRNDYQMFTSQRPLSDNPKNSETRNDYQMSTSQRPLLNNPKSSETRNDYQVSTTQRPLSDNPKSSETRNDYQVSTSQRPLEDSVKRKKPHKSEGGKSERKVKHCHQGDVQTPSHHIDNAAHRKVTLLQREKMLREEYTGRSGVARQCESKSVVFKVGSAGGAVLGSGSRVSSLDNNADCKIRTSSSCGAGPAEAKLECCPMCLMPFPAGFSQMDCDGHLAQCLSEMNMDMVW